MSLDISRLEKVRSRGGKIIARCPACAEGGADKHGDHLLIADDGEGGFGCIVNPGPSGKAHRQRIHELAGVGTSGSYRPLPPLRANPKPKGKPQIPALRELTFSELGAIARLRGWHYYVGLEILRQRGLVWYGDVSDDGRKWPAWIVTDKTRRNAQARRLDGGPWRGIGNKKAKSIPNSNSSWPIGASEIGERSFVIFCEGQPDFCAAPLVAWFEGLDPNQVAPVFMAGAGNSIHSEALPYFKGKYVRIVAHADAKGREAAQRWANQLYRAGAFHIDCAEFCDLLKLDGQPVKDLADFATLLDPDPDFPPPASVFGDLLQAYGRPRKREHTVEAMEKANGAAQKEYTSAT